MTNNNEPVKDIPDGKAEPEVKKPHSYIGDLYDLVEILGTVTVVVMLLFAFVIRLNIVDGPSMIDTLHGRDTLLVSDLFYEPKAGDIVVIHKINASPYDKPIVKRVIATGGQTVDIDFSTWTLTVDGKEVDEPYRNIDTSYPTLTADYAFPITLDDDQVFVLGDNRNCSADSRTNEINLVDKRCIVGRALVRIFPFSGFTVFGSPYAD